MIHINKFKSPSEELIFFKEPFQVPKDPIGNPPRLCYNNYVVCNNDDTSIINVNFQIYYNKEVFNTIYDIVFNNNYKTAILNLNNSNQLVNTIAKNSINKSILFNPKLTLDISNNPFGNIDIKIYNPY